MAQASRSAPAASTFSDRPDSSEFALRESASHDEWLLDEALAETFPASDAIAVSSSAVSVTRSTHRRASVAAAHRDRGRTPRTAAADASDCGFDHGRRVGALATPFECDYCHAEIPATVAFSLEGSDYLYHFCGPHCIEAWCKVARRT